jgi:hypothetical protein
VQAHAPPTQVPVPQSEFFVHVLTPQVPPVNEQVSALPHPPALVHVFAGQVPVGGNEQVPLPHWEFAEHWHLPPTQELLAQSEFRVQPFA